MALGAVPISSLVSAVTSLSSYYCDQQPPPNTLSRFSVWKRRIKLMCMVDVGSMLIMITWWHEQWWDLPRCAISDMKKGALYEKLRCFMCFWDADCLPVSMVLTVRKWSSSADHICISSHVVEAFRSQLVRICTWSLCMNECKEAGASQVCILCRSRGIIQRCSGAWLHSAASVPAFTVWTPSQKTVESVS